MLKAVNPKLPMRNKGTTRNFYITKLGFKEFGSADFDGYLMLEKDEIQIHFFEYRELDPLKNYELIYIRTTEIEKWYQTLLERNVKIHSDINLTKEFP
jgi:helix-turn-helix protein